MCISKTAKTVSDRSLGQSMLSKLIVAGLLFLGTSSVALAAPIPTVNVTTGNQSGDFPPEELVGEQFCFDADFTNTGPDAGFGPYFQITLVPEFTLVSASFSDLNQSINNEGLIGPATDSVSGEVINAPLGATLYTVTFPVGSVTNGSPVLSMNLCLDMDPAATVDVLIEDAFTITPGLVFGDTPTGVNGAITGVADSEDFTPRLITYDLTDMTPENERPPGPAWAFDIEACANIASDRVIEPVDFASIEPIILPPNVQFQGPFDFSGGTDCSATTTPADLTLAPGGSIDLNCTSGTGAIGNNAEICVTFPVYITDTLDPMTCGTTGALNQAEHVSIQKSNSGSNRPGGTRNYSVDIQVDQFVPGISRLEITDVFPDGVTFNDDAVINFAGGAPVNLSGALRTIANNSPSAGETTVVFFVTDAVGALAAASGGSMQYSVTIDQNYSSTGGPVLARDVLTNVLDSVYDIASDPSASPPIAGAIGCTENSSSFFRIVDIDVRKETITAGSVQPGDLVQYRLTMEIPSGDTNNIIFGDFLPLPVFDASTINTSVDLGPNPNFELGPLDTLGLTPTSITIDAANNAVKIAWPDISTASPQVLQLDLFVEISNEPFADNLNLSNLFQAETDNTPIDSDIELTIDFINVRAPELSIEKEVDGASSGFMVGDSVNYDIVITNDSVAEAYDVIVTDTVPDGLVNCSLDSVVGGSGVVGDSPFDADGFLFTSFAAPTNNALDGLASAVLNVSCDIDISVSPGQSISNEASVGWTSSPGNTRFPDITDDAVIAIENFGAPTKVVLTTSEAATGVSGSRHELVTGEVVRFRMWVPIPEGSITNVLLRDFIPPGLEFLNDGTAMIGFVSDAAGAITATDFAQADCNAGTLEQFGLIADITPDCELPAFAETFGSGDDMRLNIGDVVNSELDANAEYIVIELNAVSLGDQTNNRNRNNSFRMDTDDGDSPITAAGVKFVFPELELTKTASPSDVDAGDIVTYTVTLEHGEDSLADAFDIRFVDVLDDTFLENFTFLTGPVAPAGETCTAANLVTDITDPFDTDNSGAGIDITFDALPEGEVCQITYSARVKNSVTPGTDIDNNARTEFDCLAGTGTNPNVTGSPPGSDCDLEVSDVATIDVLVVENEKSIVSTSLAHTTEAGTGAAAGSPRFLSIGETIRYRLEVRLPEGMAPDFIVTDLLPTGLQLVSGTETLAFVAEGAGISATPAIACGAGSLNKVGDDTTLAGITPDCAINASGGPFVSGTDPVFNLGDLMNDDMDADREFVVIEFDAIVVNELSNQQGTDLDNTFTVSIEGSNIGTTNTIFSQVVEPQLQCEVSSTPEPIDNLSNTMPTVSLTYTLTNNGSATAFQAGAGASNPFFIDLPSELENITNLVVTPSAGVLLNNTTTPVAAGNFAISGADNHILTASNLLQFDPGASLQFTFDATLQSSVVPGDVFDDDCLVTYRGQVSGGNTNGVRDESDLPEGNSGNDPITEVDDLNDYRDATPLELTTIEDEPEIGLAKALTSGPTMVSKGVHDITYTLVVENSGNVGLDTVQVIDDLSATFSAATSFAVQGIAVSSTSGTLTAATPAYTGSGANTALLDASSSTLGVGEFGTITVTVRVTPGSTLGPYNNTATSSAGSDQSTNTTSDTSDDGSDPDGNGDDDPSNDSDPTPVTFPPIPEIGLAKVVSTAPTTTGNGVYSMVYSLFVENSGGVVLNNIQVIDDLDATFGSTPYSVTGTSVSSTSGTLVASANPYNGNAGVGADLLNSAGSSLGIGESGTITISVDVTPGSALGPYNNSATTTASSTSGAVDDTSDNGTDPDGDGDGEPEDDSDPTPVSFSEDPRIGLAKSITTAPSTTGDGVYSMTYTLVLENSGDVDLNSVQVLDDLAATFAGATGFNVTGTSVTSTSGTLVASTVPFDGSTGAGANLLDAGSSSLPDGEVGTITISVDVTPGGNLGPYNNSATSSGNSPAGDAVSDTSDNGTTPDGNSDGDASDDNDPTPVTFTENPEIGVAKSITTAPSTTGNGVYSLTYTLVVENSGDVDLDDIRVVDNLASTFADATSFNVTGTTVTSTNGTLVASPVPFDGNLGAGIELLDPASSTLADGDVGTITISVDVTPGSDLGPYENNAKVSGDSPAGNNVNDNSDDGATPDGDGDGDPTNDSDPTPVSFAENPELGLAKVISTPATTTGDGVYNFVYTLFVENSGDVDLDNVQVIDDLSATFATASSFNVTGTTVNSTSGTLVASATPFDGTAGAGANLLNAANSTLAVGESGTITISVELTPGADLGPYDNTATTSGDSPADNTVNDISDQGTSPDGDGNGDPGDDSDPTPISFVEGPMIGLAKRISTAPTTSGDGVYSMTYTLFVENSGDVDLDNVQVIDDLSATFASATSFNVTGATVTSTSGSLALSSAPYDGSTGAGANLLDAGVSTLDVGEAGTITISVDVTPGSDLGPYDNTATTSGDSPADVSVNDSSDNGTNPDGDGDTDPTNDNDPTPVTFTEAPEIGLAKTISTAPSTTGDGVYSMTYTLFVENSGDVDLDNVQIIDDLSATFATASSFNVTAMTIASTNGSLIASSTPFDGNAGAGANILNAASSTLAVGEAGTITISVDVTPGANLGPYNNTAITSGDSPADVAITDNSGDGVDPDGDGDGDPSNDSDPTPVTFTEMSEIGLAKTISTAPTTTGNGVYSMVYTLFVENSGDVDLDNVQVVDDLAATFAGATFNVTATTVASSNSTLVVSTTPYDGSTGVGANLLDASASTLAVGESGTITISVDVTPGTNLGPYNNSAISSGDSPADVTATDISDNGTVPDGDGNGDPSDDGDPTPITFTEAPAIGLAKTIGAGPVNNTDGTYTLTYTFTVENSGDVDLANLQLNDDLMDTFGTATFTVDVLASNEFSVNTDYTGAAPNINLLDSTDTLLVNGGGTVDLTVTITPGADFGPFSNIANVSGTSPGGATPNDDSDDGLVPDGNGDGDPSNDSDPTTFGVSESPEIGLAKSLSTGPINNGDGTYSLTYTFVVENSGNVDLNSVQVTDSLATTYLNAGYVIDSLSSADFTVSTSFDGDADSDLLAAGNTLGDGDTGTIELAITVTPGDNVGPYDNTANAQGISPAGESVNDVSDDGTDPDGNGDDDPSNDSDPTPFEIPPQAIGIAKQVTSFTNITGAEYLVDFSLVVSNLSATEIATFVQVTDDLDATFPGVASYSVVAGSLNTGALLVNPNYDGSGDINLLTGSLPLAVGQSETITFQVQVDFATATGPFFNQAEVTSSYTNGGDPVSNDLSDSGDDPDGDNDGAPGDSGGSDDPTPINIPSQTLLKEASTPVNVSGPIYDVTYTITVTNTGSIPLTNISVADDLAAALAPSTLVNAPVVSISGFTGTGGINAAYDGDSNIDLLSGDVQLPASAGVGVITVDVRFSNAEGAAGRTNLASSMSDQTPVPVEDQAEIEVICADSDGDGVTDCEEGTGDRDGDGIPDFQDFDPMGFFYCEDNGQILTGGRVEIRAPNGNITSAIGTANGITLTEDGSDGFYRFFYDGTPGVYEIIISQLPSVGVLSTERLPAGVLDASSFTTNPAILGSGENGTSGFLTDFSAETNTPYYLEIDFAAGDPDILLNNIPMTACAGDENSIILGKSVSNDDVIVGDFASYTLSLTNTESFFLSDVTVSDLIPPGFTYVEDSAMLSRAGVRTPATVTGARPITFDVGRIESGEEVLITYLLRVGAGVVQGVYPNTAQAMIREDIGSNVATARVEVIGDPLINNTRIIGKVWHDRDQDGWQDFADATDVRIASDAFGQQGHEVGTISGRNSINDVVENHQVTVAMLYRPNSDNSFRVSTGEGTVIFVDNNGDAKIEQRPDQKNGQDIRVSTALSEKQSDLKGSRLINRYMEKQVLNITISNHGIHEEGVPSVRLATVEGLLIETDQFGRYHIEDIDDVRWDTGSNYIVKVDTASLPDDTIFTTENPRVERLTQSLMTGFNFGVVLPADTLRGEDVPLEKSLAQRLVDKSVTETRASEVRFASGEHAISAVELEALRKRLADLKEKKNLRMKRFAGHTDSQRLSAATAEKYGDNQGLSEARAEIVAETVLEELGVSGSSAETIGLGASQPLASNATAEGMAANRRVEIDVMYDEEILQTYEELRRKEALFNNNHAGVVRAIDDQSLVDPRLAMAADYNTVSVDDGAIGVNAYTNYPAYIDRLVLEVFAGHDHDLIKPLQKIEAAITHDLDVMHTLEWDVTKLNAGQSYLYRITAVGKDGKTDVTAVRTIQVVSADKISDQREPIDLNRIYGANQLERQHIAVHGGRVRIYGRDIDPTFQVSVKDEVMTVDEDGQFVLEAHMPAGDYSVPVTMVTKSGVLERTLPITISDKYMFMVGLANITFGSNDISGAVEPLSVDDRYQDDSFTSGRVAFYLKGKIKGKYLVTAQLDTTEDELDDIGDNLKAKDPTSIFRRLEDDQYYPVYGDDSSTRSDTDSQGAIYVKVEWDKSQALWGNFNSGITANEFAQYSRSLYGAQLVYQRTDYTKYDDHRISAEVFVSEPQTVAGHNEFAATGGSLYYLNQTDVVQGSERIWVEVRRRGTQQVVETIILESGKDYQFDHFQGRIILNRPLSQVSRDHFANIIRDDPLEGDDVFLLADFEYVSTGFDADDITVGGHVNAWLTDALGVGATYVTESRSGADYELKGVDLTLRAGLATYIKLEVAESDSVQASSFLSSDGGISFQPQKLLGANISGRAYGLEAQANLAEFTETGQGTIRAWYKEREAGFSSTRESAEVTDVIDIGIEANVLFSQAFDIIARAHQIERSGQSESTVVSLQGNYKLNDKLTVAVEGRYDELSDSSGFGLSHEALLLGARSAYQLSDISEIYVEGQTVVDDSGNYDDNQLFTIGWYSKFNERLGLGAEISTGDRGDAYTGLIDWSINDRVSINLESGFGNGALSTAGLTFDVSQDHQIYGSYGIDPDKVLGRNQQVSTIGQRKKFGNRLTIFNEHQWLQDNEETAVTDVFGIDISLRDQWLLTLSLQGSETERNSLVGSMLERQAATIGLSYSGADTRFGSTLEYRVDKGDAQNLEQYLSTNSIEHKFNESWRTLAKLNWSETKDRFNGGLAAQFTEASLGLAYRPVNNDRWNMLSRYTYLYDLVSPGQLVNRPDQRSHVFSVEALYNLSRRWEVGVKLATRRGEVRADRDQGRWFENGVNLAVIRARYHMTHKWDGLLEYRVLQTVDVDDERYGALAALYRHIGKNAKVGVGYNFTDYSDDLTNLDYDADGFFLDIVGKW